MSGLEQAQPQDPPQPRPSLGVPAVPRGLTSGEGDRREIGGNPAAVDCLTSPRCPAPPPVHAA